MTNNLDKNAWIRIIVFALILIWCSYISIAYSLEANPTGGFDNYIDTSDINDVIIDGADFTMGFRLLGHTLNGFLYFTMLILILVCLLVEAVLCVIPTLLIRFIGIKKTSTITPEEYKITKILYFSVIAAAFVIGLILTRFVGILITLLYTAEWAGILLIYLLALRSRSRQAR